MLNLGNWGLAAPLGGCTPQRFFAVVTLVTIDTTGIIFEESKKIPEAFRLGD
jgi:hypothetical protein